MPDATLAALLGRHRGRLLAGLARRHGLAQLGAAEDAVQQACLRALETWPAAGPPDNPAGWLFRVAEHALIDHLRHTRPETDWPDGADDHLPAWASCAATAPRLAGELDDDELALLHAACHPAIPLASQVALALRCLTDLDLATLADALLCSEAALAQRLARARQTLAGQTLAVPAGADLAPRREAVLSTLALMFSEGMKASGRQGDAQAGQAQARRLCWEAIRLARALAAHPASAHADADALAALLLLHGARLTGRLDEAGDIVPLAGQPRARWDGGLIRLGLAHLQAAQRAEALSRWHLMAGIAAQHATAPSHAATDWATIVWHYDQLQRLDASPAPRLAHAVALAEAGDAGRAHTLLQALLTTVAPALRPHTLAALARAQERLGQPDAAMATLEAAAQAARHPADARLLRARAAGLARA